MAVSASVAIDPSPDNRAPSLTRWRPSRLRAFVLHLIASCVVVGAFLALIAFAWFPGELFVLDGGWQVFRIVLPVDLVLGPLLTLALYRPDKPNVLMDMSLIVLIQVLALGYGIFTTYQLRTVAVVYSDGMLRTVSAEDYAIATARLAALEQTPVSIDDIDSSTAPFLVTPDPEPGMMTTRLQEALNGYPPPYLRIDLFARAVDSRSSLENGASNLNDLDDPTRTAVETVLDNRSLAPDTVQLHRFEARYATGIVIVDPVSARVLDYVPVTTNAPTMAAAHSADDKN